MPTGRCHYPEHHSGGSRGGLVLVLAAVVGVCWACSTSTAARLASDFLTVALVTVGGLIVAGTVAVVVVNRRRRRRVDDRAVMIAVAAARYRAQMAQHPRRAIAPRKVIPGRVEQPARIERGRQR